MPTGQPYRTLPGRRAAWAWEIPGEDSLLRGPWGMFRLGYPPQVNSIAAATATGLFVERGMMGRAAKAIPLAAAGVVREVLADLAGPAAHRWAAGQPAGVRPIDGVKCLSGGQAMPSTTHPQR